MMGGERRLCDEVRQTLTGEALWWRVKQWVAGAWRGWMKLKTVFWKTQGHDITAEACESIITCSRCHRRWSHTYHHRRSERWWREQSDQSNACVWPGKRSQVLVMPSNVSGKIGSSKTHVQTSLRKESRRVWLGQNHLRWRGWGQRVKHKHSSRLLSPHSEAKCPEPRRQVYLKTGSRSITLVQDLCHIRHCSM